jgi:DNA-binding response OmpR family regulator
MNVLLLEPDMVLGEVYSRALEAAGHRVDWQRTAATAVQALDGQAADVIIAELQIPVHNGMEFLYELRSYGDWRDIPVIIHSLLFPERVVKGLTYQELGIAQYLYKPQTTLSDLTAAVSATVVV